MSAPSETDDRSDTADAGDATTVYDLAPEHSTEAVETGARYHATVNGVVAYGVFVDVADDVSGLVHESKLDAEYGVGDDLVVRLDEIRPNGDLGFDEAAIRSEERRVGKECRL